jgi:hypothetical protein
MQGCNHSIASPMNGATCAPKAARSGANCQGPDDRVERSMLRAIDATADATGACLASLATLASMTRLSEKWAGHVIDRLEVEGWIVRRADPDRIMICGGFGGPIP